MSIKILKPTSPGRRGMTSQDFSEVTTKTSVKSLLKPRKQRSGRNNQGVITVRRRGGGAKRHYRIVSWKLPDNFKGEVKEIEYDPNRSAHIARIQDQADQTYHYIIAPKGLKIGRIIEVGPQAPIEIGNRLPLKDIPLGLTIHSIELVPGQGAQIVRTAGAGARLSAKDGDYARIRLPSREIRLINLKSYASIGVIGNDKHKNIKLGKAGRRRLLGRRPKVRGVAMNAVAHPHGGGEGKAKGYKAPKTPWGQKTLGYKTRHKRRSNKFIIRTRHVRKRKKKG